MLEEEARRTLRHSEHVQFFKVTL